MDYQAELASVYSQNHSSVYRPVQISTKPNNGLRAEKSKRPPTKAKYAGMAVAAVLDPNDLGEFYKLSRQKMIEQTGDGKCSSCSKDISKNVIFIFVNSTRYYHCVNCALKLNLIRRL